MVQRIFDARIAKKGQIVIPKPLRMRFRLRENSLVILFGTEDGVLIRSIHQKPWSGMRGHIKGSITIAELDRLLEEAALSLLEPK